MIDVDRHHRLRELDERHEDLARQLEELNNRVEQALVRSGAAPAAPSQPSQLTARIATGA
jgi:hypothetical protein